MYFAAHSRLVANRKAEEARLEAEAEKRIKRIELAKQFPQTKDDFEMLYGEVQKWKIAELKRIARLYEGPARIAEVNVLLDKEIQLRNGIEKQRVIVRKAMEDFRNEKMLTKLGEPITWVGYKGEFVERVCLNVSFYYSVNDYMMSFIDMKVSTTPIELNQLLAKCA